MTNVSALSRKPTQLIIFGRNGAGACPCPGAVKGDSVLGAHDITTLASNSSAFESTISVTGQIQQSSVSNLSSKEYVISLMPQS